MAATTSVPALEAFHAPVRAWFEASFAAPTRPQELGWPAIAAGENTLILAPTGSGKTLAAFMAAIDRVMFDPPPAKPACRVLYISPLKALTVDVERNLRAPLVGIAREAERTNTPVHVPRVAIRTGDTPSRERAQFMRAPADIFITTPESLYLVLTSGARDALRSVEWVIVDEIHTMVGSKRGAHLALSLERLEHLRGARLQRIGLSATQRPLDEVARFLGGLDDGEPRPVRIVDAGQRKELELRVEVPVEDMAKLGEIVEVPSGPAAQGERRTSIWPSLHPLILDLIRTHTSTLIFANSRRLAERLASALNELAGEEIVHAHHGSIAREQRLLIEDELKSGRLPALVATSSLELGIDMGAIDLVVQVETPPSVASGIQRIGRAGHHIGAASKGVILPKFRGDLLACAALTERMRAGAVEEMRYPRNPLDVLAQQVVAMVAMDDWSVDDLERVVRGAAPFGELPRSMLEAVLDMLSGRYPSDEFAELRPRITWDRIEGRLRSREGAKRMAITNGGTIPDRGLYGVFLLGAERGQGRVGELDEEMVFETRVGDVFLLGASSWRVEEITHDRVLVSPAPGVPGKMPFWKGESVGRPLEFGRAIGALTRTLRAQDETAAMARLTNEHDLDERAARNLLQYLRDQHDAAGAVPDDRTIVVERYVDDLGDWRVCVLSPFGAQVHAPWAMAVSAIVRDRFDAHIEIVWTDDGIVARFPEADRPPPVEWLFPDPGDVDDLVRQELGATALFAGRFREAAGRALLLPRRFPGQRAPLWHQRKRASSLLQITAKYGSFPIVLEAYRECLRDVFDMPALVELLGEVRDRRIRVVTADTRTPSPFAASLLFNYVANFIYDYDAPLAEQRAQALTVDPAQLRELMGEVALRELLDADALDELEHALQHLSSERKARHADALHDLLLRLGDMTVDDAVARSDGDGAGWLAQLERERRVVRLQIAGEERHVAVEDAARYRDALGIPLPAGLPAALLAPTDAPLVDLVSRYARTHGPFALAACAARFGAGVAQVTSALQRLADDGRVVEGEFRPGGSGREWCDAGVLRTLRQRSLARLRREVEPVEQDALGRLYIAWHGIDAPRSGASAILDAVAQLQGAAIPASALESRILPARIDGYEPRELDELMASGSVVWCGVGALGTRDGRVALYLAEHVDMLHTPAAERPDGATHERIREHLAARGASFFPQLHAAVGGFAPEVLEALWDLVWSGEVTNDTLQPLRAYLRAGRDDRARRHGPRQRGAPAEAAGRWSLIAAQTLRTPSPTERITARVTQMLERHGVLTREAVQSEGFEGGFSSVYGVLKAMEDAGRIRRGYFVAGRGATQFALPGAVDRLRTMRELPSEPRAIVLAATDPANPYGAALPWPEREGRHPMRAAGAIVVIVDGALAAWMGRGERDLMTFISDDGTRDTAAVRRAVATALAAEVRQWSRHTGARGGRVFVVRTVDGTPARETPMADAFSAAGFAASGDGFVRRL